MLRDWVASLRALPRPSTPSHAGGFLEVFSLLMVTELGLGTLDAGQVHDQGFSKAGYPAS